MATQTTRALQGKVGRGRPDGDACPDTRPWHLPGRLKTVTGYIVEVSTYDNDTPPGLPNRASPWSIVNRIHNTVEGGLKLYDNLDRAYQAVIDKMKDHTYLRGCIEHVKYKDCRYTRRTVVVRFHRKRPTGLLVIERQM